MDDAIDDMKNFMKFYKFKNIKISELILGKGNYPTARLSYTIIFPNGFIDVGVGWIIERADNDMPWIYIHIPSKYYAEKFRADLDTILNSIERLDNNNINVKN